MRATPQDAPLFAESSCTSGSAPEASGDLKRKADLATFLHLTEVVLPATARAERWPIRFDHCFKRICLDHAFSAPWYKHLPRPAVRHLQGEALASAVRCATELVEGGAFLLAQRNAESLGWRGKRGPGKAR